MAERLERFMEDDYLCRYDVPVGPQHGHPHFLILHPGRGILILEIQDWKIDQIREMSPKSFTMDFGGRRTFFDALTAESAGTAEALEQIKALYAVEEEIRDRKLVGDAKQLHRLTHSRPLVELFFKWVDRQLERQGFTPMHPFIHALNYVRERRVGLELFLTNPDVPIDTDFLERALRVVPMGRKSWLFCWTELGAKHVGIIQRLIVTCRLHGIDP